MSNNQDGFLDAFIKAMYEAGEPFADEEIADVLDSAIPRIVESLVNSLDDDTADMLAWHKDREARFNGNVAQRWEEGFDLMTKLSVMCLETGEITLKQCRPPVDSPEAYKFEALLRLHARACLIYGEALCLMKGGFADGAMARWRSLHEIATIAFYLANGDSRLSERYLRHQFVEKHKKLRSYKAHEKRLRLQPIDPAQVQLIEQEYQRLITEYGIDFKGNYGWAAAALKKANPNFSDIEKKVGVDHLRPYYKWACEKIHASTNGLYKTLGLGDDEMIMLAGPSNYGLTDPAQMCALSLYQTTVAFAASWQNLDLIVLCRACQEAHRPIGETFLRIQRDLERDEMALRQRRTVKARRRKRANARKKALRESAIITKSDT
jgi:hypothetical protein